MQTHFKWSDDEIMEIPICRLRQQVELIGQEKIEDLRLQARLLEWQTKNFGSFLSAVAMSPEQAKSLQKAVKALKLPLEDEDTTDTRPIEEVIETGAKVDVDDPAQPSFEQLAAAMGAVGTV